MKCPCTSGRDYADCCEPIIAGRVKAATAEHLMRSRYSAYALGEIDWIVQSQSPDGRQFVDRNATEQWSRRATWHRLEVVGVDGGAADDSEGFVDFKAHYQLNGESIVHHEVASFRKEGGEWFFVDGVEVKPRPFRRLAPRTGPNEPCTCGSGRKFKKCCGKPGAGA